MTTQHTSEGEHNWHYVKELDGYGCGYEGALIKVRVFEFVCDCGMTKEVEGKPFSESTNH